MRRTSYRYTHILPAGGKKIPRRERGYKTLNRLEERPMPEGRMKV